MTPPGKDAPAGGTHRALKQDEATTTQDLLQAVLSRDNLVRAWKRVKANKGAPGIDGVTIEAFPAHAREHWPAVRAQIEGGRYKPQAVRRVEIPKPDSGKRLLGEPAWAGGCLGGACRRRSRRFASIGRAAARPDPPAL